MAEHIRLHFDPICPWCYQTSRWLKRLEELGEVELSYALFSLGVQNEGKESDAKARAHARSRLPLRTAVLVREDAGDPGVGAFYTAIGRRFHQEGQALDDPEVVGAALEDAGLDSALAEKAQGDERTWEVVCQEHRDLGETTRSFGVPTIALDGGEGPAIFGPVISEVPDDDEAVELLGHVVWLARNENFAELKRDRVAIPDLESVRRGRERRDQRRVEGNGERGR